MQKIVLFIVIVVLLGGGYYFYAQKNKQAKAPTTENGSLMENKEENNQNQPAATSTPSPLNQSSDSGSGQASPAPGTSKGTFSSGEEMEAPDILMVQVNYDGNKFDPASVDIKAGDIVIFKNNSSGAMRPASAPHPSHTAYPEFDPKEAIDPGGKWQFKFEKAGSWKYHNHLNPSQFGTINVSAK